MISMKPAIDESKCIICCDCIDRCPSGALTEGSDSAEFSDPDGCYECGLCADICAMNAIDML
jgi:NAD-dependent dihydropyrimidine dehydrogenase PreA subunit